MKYGWKKQTHDARDFKLSTQTNMVLPPVVDLKNKMPGVYDQGQLGSCTGNGIGAIVAYCTNNLLNPSRLFIYYNERLIEGTVKQDAGANIRDGIKSINTQGVCDEKLWAYNISNFKTKPTKTAYKAALLHESLAYYSVVQTENEIKKALVSGYPIVFGFEVKESFESQEVASTGNYQPKAGEQIIGGHCVVIVGYDDTLKVFKVRNSWGTSWGQVGYFTMPYSEVLNTNISSDFWVVQTIKG